MSWGLYMTTFAFGAALRPTTSVKPSEVGAAKSRWLEASKALPRVLGPDGRAAVPDAMYARLPRRELLLRVLLRVLDFTS